jgi:triphosphoribosyl-dephospho-CoA synthase
MIKADCSGFFLQRMQPNWSATPDRSAASTWIYHPSRSATADNRSRLAAHLASLAGKALIEEAELTPKPALVDERGSGAHRDLSLELMKRSADALRPHFELMALISWQEIPNRSLREALGAMGRLAEHSMLLATGGVNAHRGAIWSLGLIVAATAMTRAIPPSPKEVAKRAGQLARLFDRHAPEQPTNGLRVMRRYKIPGARGEAQAGFPHVVGSGLPRLYRSRQRGASERNARIDALLAIMMSLYDTCLLHRGGLVALHTAQTGAAAVLQAGGAASARGQNLLYRLDRDLIALNASPGGSADLLAATLFLDSLTISRSICHGDTSF